MFLLVYQYRGFILFSTNLPTIYISKTDDPRGFFLNKEYIYVTEKFTDKQYYIVFACTNITS